MRSYILVPIPIALDKAIRIYIAELIPGSKVLFCGWERTYELCQHMVTVSVALPDHECSLTHRRSKLRDEARNPPPPPAVSE